nr:MAG TPA: hypothetical protein [Caudoviricetes sp.]
MVLFYIIQEKNYEHPQFVVILFSGLKLSRHQETVTRMLHLYSCKIFFDI